MTAVPQGLYDCYRAQIERSRHQANVVYFSRLLATGLSNDARAFVKWRLAEEEASLDASKRDGLRHTMKMQR